MQRDEPIILEKAISPIGGANNIRRVGSRPWVGGSGGYKRSGRDKERI